MVFCGKHKRCVFTSIGVHNWHLSDVALYLVCMFAEAIKIYLKIQITYFRILRAQGVSYIINYGYPVCGKIYGFFYGHPTHFLYMPDKAL